MDVHKYSWFVFMFLFCLFFIHFFIKLLLWLNRTLSALWLVKNVNKNVMRQSKRWNLRCTGEKKINPVVSLSKIIFFIANLPSFYVHFYYYNSRSFVDWIVGNQQKKKTKIWCRTNTVCNLQKKKKERKITPVRELPPEKIKLRTIE